MSDEPHTDHSDVKELGFLRKARGLLAQCAARDAEDLKGDESDAKVRKIAAIVIALTRITEMEDRYEGRIAERIADPDARERAVRKLRRDAARLIDLPDAEFEAAMRDLRADVAGPAPAREAADRGVPGDRAAAVEGDRS